MSKVVNSIEAKGSGVAAGRHGRIESLEREPIAIVGMGCRFPGVRDVREFWQLLIDGRETIGDYPGGRFPYMDLVYTPGSPLADRIATQRGGFLQSLDRFDADFFGISPREAALLDPQQRLLLEVAWEAIDDAGFTQEQLAGSRTGVFVGVWTSDYEDCLYEYTPDIDFHATTGGGRYGASGRIAYALDLRGPNLTVDTACSSSLVAIHLACQSLLTGESTIALAGGANTILRPEITLVYSNAGMLAPDGRCKFGDAAADGYVRSEGAGIVVLKRLSRAVADGDPIYAVIRGSAVNNDGRSSGLLVSPSREGQEDVIRTAMAVAGVSSDAVDYVEAHGTGTLVGDPIEIETIGRVMTSETRVSPCAIGSVKTNIGHTESAAGVAGVIKVALALNHGVLPASLHFKDPSPRIAWDGLQVTVPTKTAPWPDVGRLSVAGVSGFGITGTNAHALLEAVERDEVLEVPESSDEQTSGEKVWPYMFFLSAKTPAALADVAKSWRELLANDPAWPKTLADLSYTAGLRRTQHESRLVVAAANRTELDAKLAAWLEGDERPGVVAGERFEQALRKAVFIYPGQGGQWIGMGRTLYERAPVFRDALNRCDAAIQKHAGWSVVEALLASPEQSRFQEIDIIQPTLFALMVALTELWRSLGVEPAAVVGHSMGEAAAAAVSGSLSLDDAAAVICHRSRLMKRVRGKGLMAVVELSLDDTRTAIEDAGRVWIGASNGATSTVISGDADAVEALIRTFEAREIFCRRIQVDVASHSGHMDEVRDELEVALGHIRPHVGSIPMYSTTTGEIEDGSRLDAKYWGKNLRQPVLFHSAVEQLLRNEFDVFVEVNAHPVLTHAITESIQQSGRDAVVTGTLRRDSDDQLEMLGALGRLHVARYPIDMRHVISKGECIRLPVYPWQRERHWFEPPTDATSKLQMFGSANVPQNDAGRVDPAECLYELEWVDATQADLSHKASGVSQWKRTTRAWVVLSNERRGDYIADTLRAIGHACVIIRPGVEFEQIDAQTFKVNPTSVDDIQRLLREYAAPGSGIIHAWSLTESEALPDVDGILEAQLRGSLSAAMLVRAVATLELLQPPRVWLVTHGAQTVLNEPTATPWDASLIGFGRIAAAEHPEIPCTNLDLSTAPTDSELHFAAQLIVRDVTEQQVAVRGSRQFNARYRRAVSDNDMRVAHQQPSIRPDVTYVITGGLGGIGLLTARWLVDNGARYLALAGRRGPSEKAAQVIAELERVGAQVKVVAADIADPAQVALLIETAESDMPPIAGVLHMAVVVDHALLRDATEESFRRVFGPKMIGAWNLYLALRDRPLDFYVLFSSMVDVIPQPRSASYASANAFLDGLARYGASRGMPIQSIQWEPWAGTGLMNEAKTKSALRMYEAQGVRPMSPALGFRILERALATATPVLLAASVDWETFSAVCGADAGASEFLHLAEDARKNKADKPASDATTVESSTQDVRATLGALAAGRPRLSALELHLREQLASVLKTSPDRLDLQKPVGNMGVDSLLALEFVRRLSPSLGIKVPATVVFNYPTIKKLAVLLESRMGFGDSDDVASTAIVAASTILQPAQESGRDIDVDAMSDIDAIRALSGNS